MLLKIFLSVFLGIAIFASPTHVYANTSNSTAISINIVIPERAEDQNCVVGFKSNAKNTFTPLKSAGCHYDSKILLQTAYRQASTLNTQGFATVVVTAP